VPLRPSAPLLLPVVLPLGSVVPPPALPVLPWFPDVLLLPPVLPAAPVVPPLVVEPPVEDGLVVELALPDVVGEPEPVADVVSVPVVAVPADAFAELLLLPAAPLPPATPISTSLSAVLFWWSRFVFDAELLPEFVPDALLELVELPCVVDGLSCGLLLFVTGLFELLVLVLLPLAPVFPFPVLPVSAAARLATPSARAATSAATIDLRLYKAPPDVVDVDKLTFQSLLSRAARSRLSRTS